ncbi:MAG: bifunctional 4-hydroxy-2-oxoglutarate aldolase/2-dehydro-3-deoxy-phosphogluconate aldolase [Verrucomicrobia bacterium]|nr:bifunctional 4-hydroxy-2-oxoglutarate aldolase/2-dehydro-3-deoxy-phosphogluconate aldolase [Verrucomicrobiota bacterium]MDA1086284.1 bifunctional 4-hydroxy-2-oxoglutarate aldolase/2-dehydro-3-deoxy-phosphogluconate aldolase [Verrucomicrobiota bacterium]
MSLDAIREARVLPAVTIEKAADAVPLASALVDGGLRVMEVTLRTDAAADSIARIKDSDLDLLVGAGTILNPEDVRRAVEAGAAFGVSPGCSELVLREAQALKLPMIPGVVTPTEIERAMELGYSFLKFFPAESSGGVKKVKALMGPYMHTGLRFMVTGGINASNMGEYLALPIVDAVCGSWFVNQRLIDSASWSQVKEFARGARDIAHQIKSAQ